MSKKLMPSSSARAMNGRLCSSSSVHGWAPRSGHAVAHAAEAEPGDLEAGSCRGSQTPSLPPCARQTRAAASPLHALKHGFILSTYSPGEGLSDQPTASAERQLDSMPATWSCRRDRRDLLVHPAAWLRGVRPCFSRCDQKSCRRMDGMGLGGRPLSGPGRASSRRMRNQWIQKFETPGRVPSVTRQGRSRSRRPDSNRHEPAYKAGASPFGHVGGQQGRKDLNPVREFWRLAALPGARP